MKDFTKKKRLLHWDEDDVLQNVIKERYDEWTRIYGTKPPSIEFIKEEFEKDPGYYWREWDNFLSDLSTFIEKTNIEKWESPKAQEGHKFRIDDGKHLLEICELEEPITTDVYTTQKNGFLLVGKEYIDKEPKECLVLPSCEEGYRRDFERKGICVKYTQSEEEIERNRGWYYDE